MSDFTSQSVDLLNNKKSLRTYHRLASFSVIVCTVLICSLSLSVFSKAVVATTEPLTLWNTINIAHKNDDWLLKSMSIENALIALSDGANTLPDPMFSISLLNLPTNGFAFDQEPMTQLRVSASQQFSRGNTLNLQQEKYQISSKEQPLLRRDRKNKIALNAELLWLDTYHAQSSQLLVEESRPLFDKLRDIVSASYAASVGRASQQDIIRAELELMRLNERLIRLNTQHNVAISRLSQYLYISDGFERTDLFEHDKVTLPMQLHATSREDEKRLSLLTKQNHQRLYLSLLQHPLILAKNQRVQALNIDTLIAKEGLKAQYGLSASYAFRDDSSNGQSRADFFSVGLNVSMPLFTTAKQDAQVSSAVHMAEAVKTEKRLLLKELYATVQSTYAEYIGLSERFAIYENKIIPQMAQYSQTTLTAYTNDAGDFAEVVSTKIAELDAQLTLLNLKIEIHKRIAIIRYHLPLAAKQGELHSSSAAHLTGGH